MQQQQPQQQEEQQGDLSISLLSFLAPEAFAEICEAARQCSDKKRGLEKERESGEKQRKEASGSRKKMEKRGEEKEGAEAKN